MPRLRPSAVTGVGAVTPAGVGVAPLLEGLWEGRSYIAELRQPWAPPPHSLGGAVREVGARDRIPARRLRRLGRLSQLAVVAASGALEQAGIADATSGGVVLGTGLGALHETVELMTQLAQMEATAVNPSLFPASVMNVAAAHVSMELGMRGYNTTINHREISTEMAVLAATQTIALGHAELLLVGGVDELSAPVHHGFRRFGALTTTAPRPYRAGRDGMALGEGAGVIVLEDLLRARRRGARVLAQVVGVGAAGGERPLSGWGPAREQGRDAGPAVDAGVQAIRSALAEAGLAVDDVDLVVGCGCGSPSLDQLEAQVLVEAFAGRAVPLTSPHGALGTWMAAGALRLLLAIDALSEGRICPTVTAGDVDPAAPVPGLVTAGRSAEVRVALVCSHAIGGGSAAVALRRDDAS
jgi:3-oxoacyl-(acyl-carrier-protein) synthase